MKGSFQIPPWLSSKKVFLFLSVAIFILLPLLSLDAGISGDEPVHYRHAEYVYNYFATGGADQSALNTPQTHLRYYGQVVDNISFIINKLINSNNPYLTRHIMNALLGALILLFAGLLTVRMAGYRAGILAILFLLLSPRILGHSYNNLKDIPFAAGYIIAVYGLARVIIEFPSIKAWPWVWMCLGLALAFGTRAGGLILIPIFFLFIFLKWFGFWPFRQMKKREALLQAVYFFSLALLTSLAGSLLAMVLWPYALQSPLKHSLESLSVMTHFTVSIRQLFEGQWLWSENLPGYYPLKYILITNPLVIIAGFALQFAAWNRKSRLLMGMLNFVLLFPLAWVIIKESNLYGAWRHVLFVYPPLVVISALSWESLLLKSGTIMKTAIAAILVTGLAGPLVHIVKYHPVEYVYFNKLTNGVKGAFSKYETDYYYHSLGPATKWLKSYLENNDSKEEIVVASNFPLGPYFIDDKRITPVYTHYFTRAKIDWDYGIFVNTFLGPDYLNSKNWPPENSLYSFEIEGKIICSVIRRPAKSDLRGIELYRQGDFKSSINELKSAIDIDPKNESAKLYLAWAYHQEKDIEKSDSTALDLLEQQPGNEMAMDIIGRNQVLRGDFSLALETFQGIIIQNYKYLHSYRQAAIAADSMGDYKKAARFLERGFQLGLRDSLTVASLVNYLELAEYPEKAKKFRTILNKK